MYIRKRITSGNRETVQKNNMSMSSKKLMKTWTHNVELEELREEIKENEEATSRQRREIKKWACKRLKYGNVR